jgi:SecD/SecF fusion protein
MKIFPLYGIVILALCSALFASCGDSPIEHGTEYILEVPAGTNNSDLNAASLIIQKRLDNFGLEGDYELSHDAGRITVRVRSGVVTDNSKMRALLQSSASLKFRAMYSFSDIANTVSEANQRYLRMNHIDSLNPTNAGLAGLIAANSNDPYSPMIFSCRAKDTTAVMEILRTDSIAMLFNGDVVFRWGRSLPLQTGEPTYGLFACKEGFNYVMDGNNIESADALMNSDMGSWEISLVFDPAGAKEFARITRTNVGRSLAIELDGFVYSYPTVNGEITGGLAMITGNFTETEAGYLAKILSAGKLPVPLAIVQESQF